MSGMEKALGHLFYHPFLIPNLLETIVLNSNETFKPDLRFQEYSQKSNKADSTSAIPANVM